MLTDFRIIIARQQIDARYWYSNSVRPSVRLLPNLWRQYFENDWTDLDANWHKWFTDKGTTLGIIRSKVKGHGHTILAYKALHTGQPPYLSELLQHYEPTRTLRSSSSFQLSVPRHNLEFGSRAFQISAPKIWSLLPASIHSSPSLPTFRRHLKTHYFQSAYSNR